LSLQSLLDRKIVFDGFNACFVAMLANACWPLQGDAKHREIVQITPLVPHQGFTNDCGVHTVIYFAGLFFQTDWFIAALEPGRRLVFAENLVLNTRKQMLEWST